MEEAETAQTQLCLQMGCRAADLKQPGALTAGSSLQAPQPSIAACSSPSCLGAAPYYYGGAIRGQEV